ncbi:DUF6286 domain-containing protein [Paractinoplanes rishiriensis]|uniref:DUF6286 domain-containing protein n=1 Tax=Paractinoplanes rishiriensis TaxID=1050105 RepID=A0A919KB28_9ACTN|nr:DUF6286 domain-containing protein [Actinoplanes rishiriensis]GIF01854.1 hypothetical protein Ari01nite_93180 [Actinoplanes rishiriensis]
MTSARTAFATSPSRPVHDGPAMTAAEQKSGAGRVGFVGPLMAVLLTAIGVVLLHDAIARIDARPGRTWIAAIVDGLDGLTAEWWMIPAGLAVALIGVWLIVTALRPRSRKTLAVTSKTGVFLRTGDIARLASAAADDVDGVLAANSVASRRAVTVTVESDRDQVADLVRDAVEQRLSALQKPLTVKVRVRSHYHLREGN